MVKYNSGWLSTNKNLNNKISYKYVCFYFSQFFVVSYDCNNRVTFLFNTIYLKWLYCAFDANLCNSNKFHYYGDLS